ncbi:MAG TPA: hypothetical protein DIU15_01085 [Deltaproteobacteria bacterium]|nr:hypothetical protein [Deltaproteobacteria bacterium]HCP44620.1 hypothetical protein [Deltaproteobacteria bacterium]
MLSRRLSLSSLLIVCCLTVASLVSWPSRAEADSARVKFYVAEYRLKLVVAEGFGVQQPPLVLELRGKGSVLGGDKVEFRWTVPDATPYLELLSACGLGRLNGVVSLGASTGNRSIEGTGPLMELNCRMILK